VGIENQAVGKFILCFPFSALTSDLDVRTFTKERKGGPARPAGLCIGGNAWEVGQHAAIDAGAPRLRSGQVLRLHRVARYANDSGPLRMTSKTGMVKP